MNVSLVVNCALAVIFGVFFIIVTVVFPIIHLNKALPLKSQYEDAFNDVCECNEIANLLELGSRRTALGKECIAKYYNPIFDDAFPINKFFGNGGIYPERYDDRADILNNITSNYIHSVPSGVRYASQYPPRRDWGEDHNSNSNKRKCDNPKFTQFQAGIAFCFISLITVLLIIPICIIWYYANEKMKQTTALNTRR